MIKYKEGLSRRVFDLLTRHLTAKTLGEVYEMLRTELEPTRCYATDCRTEARGSVDGLVENDGGKL